MQIMIPKNNGKVCRRMRCAVFLSPRSEVGNGDFSFVNDRKPGFIQISPSKEGPWTTVRLNYAAPSACWRLGDEVVASEVSVRDGNRYVNIRSLVSVHNNTTFILDLCLVPQLSENMTSLKRASFSGDLPIDTDRIQTEEYFETQKYSPIICWVGCTDQGSGESHSVSYYCQYFLES